MLGKRPEVDRPRCFCSGPCGVFGIIYGLGLRANALDDDGGSECCFVVDISAEGSGRWGFRVGFQVALGRALSDFWVLQGAPFLKAIHTYICIYAYTNICLYACRSYYEPFVYLRCGKFMQVPHLS